MRRASFLLFFLLIGSLAVVTTPVRAEIPGQWTYSGWQYRVPITIYNPNNYSLTNYQLELEINSSWPIWTHISENGSDIRFTTLNGSIINYYVENWNYTAKTATVWVKVPSLPALSYTTIYMYYGNPNATSESDPNKVFILFDNFNTLNTSRWTNGALSIADRNTNVKYVFYNDLYVRDGNLIMNKSLGSHTCANIEIQNFELKFGELVEAKVRPLKGSDWTITLAVGSQDNSVYVFFSSYDSSLDIEYEISNSKKHLADTSGEVGEWYVFGIARTQNVTYQITVRNNKTNILTATASVYLRTNNVFLSQSSYKSTTELAEVDWVRIREYANKVPTYTLGSEQGYTPPVDITVVFLNDGTKNTLNNVYLTINRTSIGMVNSSIVLTLNPGYYSFTASKQHYITSTAKVFVNSSGTIVLNLTRERYIVKFYAYTNGTALDNFTVYANSTLLGTFSSGESALVKYGTYLFKFEKSGYRPAIQIVTVAQNGTIVTFTNLLPANVYSLTMTFYDAINNTELNNVSVSVDGIQHVLDSGSSLTLKEDNYTLAFSKPGYENSTMRIELTSDTVLTVYLQPASQADVNLVNATELVKNITSYVSITPINPYAKAFMDSGGSFGDTIKLALRGDSLMRLILPQVLILAIVIVVLVQTTSPLAAIGGALIGWAMSLGILGEAPSLRNSGMTFMLMVFLVAWTLWDLFYNYSRET